MEKKKSQRYIIIILFLVVGIYYFISGGIKLFGDDFTRAVIHFVLGILFLIIALIRYKKKDNK
ncbi:hypothetical protein ISS37_05845 [candidate division KSB1 bacterium]|nr:hypothetical protein [candidate division KSB1 bacterium]